MCQALIVSPQGLQNYDEDTVVLFRIKCEVWESWIGDDAAPKLTTLDTCTDL